MPLSQVQCLVLLMGLRNGLCDAWAQVPGLPAPIENMILRYVKQKADWWTQVVRPSA